MSVFSWTIEDVIKAARFAEADVHGWKYVFVELGMLDATENPRQDRKPFHGPACVMYSVRVSDLAWNMIAYRRSAISDFSDAIRKIAVPVTRRG